MKKLQAVILATTLLLPAYQIAAENNDVAALTYVGKTFVDRWKAGYESGKKGAFNKAYRECMNFADKPTLTTKHGEEIYKLITFNTDAKPYAEKVFKVYIDDYKEYEYVDIMYASFKHPESIKVFCEDDEFSTNFVTALYLVMGQDKPSF